MKKKKQRRLRLHRETLRRLEEPLGAEVWGGCTPLSPHTLTRPTLEHCGLTAACITGPKQK